MYGVPDKRLGEVVGATLYVAKLIDESSLREFLSSRISHFEIPHYIDQQLVALPRIASGKIAKRQIRQATSERLGLA